MRLSLNISPCPNDTFMFDALVNGRIDTRGIGFDVNYADIEELNRRVIKGRVDVSKTSYAVLPEIHNKYRVLDSGSALGHGNGPLLVARENINLNTPGLKIAVPGFHTTANLLMKRLFPQAVDKCEVLFSEIAERVLKGDFDAGVLIHEGRFTYRKHGLMLIADLGKEWEAVTALPLPLGAIVVSRNIPDEIRTTVEDVLRESVQYAFDHPDVSRGYVKSHAQEMDDAVIENHIGLFVNDYSLSLGSEGRKAVHELTGILPE